MRKLEDWIEYMEGEDDTKRMGQLGLLLQHSPENQIVLENLRRLRRLIAESDSARDIESTISKSAILEDLHDRIMSQLSGLPESSAPQKEKRSSPDGGRGSSLGSYKN